MIERGRKEDILRLKQKCSSWREVFAADDNERQGLPGDERRHLYIPLNDLRTQDLAKSQMSSQIIEFFTFISCTFLTPF